MKKGIDDATDAFELVVSDGEIHAVMRVKHSALALACERGPRAAWDLLTNEFSGVLWAFENRKKNIPVVGARVLVKGEPLPRTIITVNRATNIVGLAVECGGGVANDPELVHWSDCEYV